MERRIVWSAVAGTFFGAAAVFGQVQGRPAQHPMFFTVKAALGTSSFVGSKTADQVCKELAHVTGFDSHTWRAYAPPPQGDVQADHDTNGATVLPARKQVITCLAMD